MGGLGVLIGRRFGVVNLKFLPLSEVPSLAQTFGLAARWMLERSDGLPSNKFSMTGLVLSNL
jgi:hypothetical protein